MTKRPTIDIADVAATARALVASPKGILAVDESVATMTKRLEANGITSTEQSRRDYRELMVATPSLAQHISGVILNDETMRQTGAAGTPLPDLIRGLGLLPGIKVDTGAMPLAGSPRETVTEGLDNLRDRIADYRQRGAVFAKWRAVMTVGPALPSRACISVNAHALARYAALCQEGGLVPIVEPEVLMTGDHSIDRCAKVTEETLRVVFSELAAQQVALEAIVLKPSMVVPGADGPGDASAAEVAERTIALLRRCVPAAVPGVAFLSGGQSAELATAHLDAMNRLGPQPWQVTFSYGRALQDPVLAAWKGEPANIDAAQQALLHRARCNSAATTGAYDPTTDRA